ncbi:MAG: hypothetical protein NVS2B8_10920 [Vulcanimicrobiaceae bacterium]
MSSALQRGSPHVAPLASTETRRLAALRALDILDTSPEAEFDAVVRLAASFCNAPMAMMVLVDDDRAWVKSAHGVAPAQAPREHSFCTVAIDSPRPLIVPDATLDPRFASLPSVTGEPHLRFYAGVPLVTDDGAAVGTLCAVDTVARRLEPHQIEALEVAARYVTMLLAKRSADARLRLLELVAVHASDGVVIMNMDSGVPEDGRIEYVNDAFTRLTGYDEAELRHGELGRMLLDLARDQRVRAERAGAIAARETVVEAAAALRKDGAPADVEISLSPVVSQANGKINHVVAILRDAADRKRVMQEHARAEAIALANTALQHEIDERRRAEAKLSFAASHDELTDLPNRAYFKASLELALADARSGNAGGGPVVVFVDLDRFKRINDTLGHLMGDRLLVEVASRLRAAVRGCDVVARFAGDEFTILFKSVRDEGEAAVVVERLARAFGESFNLGSDDVFITASIGATIVRPSYASSDDVLRDADIAMFAAKESGRARVQFFNQELRDRFFAVTDFEASLFRALQRNEFRLVYQPIVSLARSHATLGGFEALARWKSPHGEISPVRFIPAAEETGLIIPLGEWILDEAVARLAAWHAQYAGTLVPMPTLSVNVSAKQFVSSQFVEQVDRAIARHAIDPRYLALELTETTLMENVDKARSVLAALRERGVKIHLDDFGTGYCSFGYLRQFRVDCLKIDRSFVSGTSDAERTTELADPDIVRAIISLAHSLQIDVIAEGIETDAQRLALVDLGCDAGQGYLFSRPLEETSETLQRARDAIAANDYSNWKAS